MALFNTSYILTSCWTIWLAQFTFCSYYSHISIRFLCLSQQATHDYKQRRTLNWAIKPGLLLVFILSQPPLPGSLSNNCLVDCCGVLAEWGMVLLVVCHWVLWQTVGKSISLCSCLLLLGFFPCAYMYIRLCPVSTPLNMPAQFLATSLFCLHSNVRLLFHTTDLLPAFHLNGYKYLCFKTSSYLL